MKLVFGIEKRHIAAFALLLLCLSSLTLGQTTVTGGISGTVTDPSGAMVGGAKLTLKSVATGETTTTTSSATGDFQLPLRFSSARIPPSTSRLSSARAPP